MVPVQTGRGALLPCVLFSVALSAASRAFFSVGVVVANTGHGPDARWASLAIVCGGMTAVASWILLGIGGGVGIWRDTRNGRVSKTSALTLFLGLLVAAADIVAFLTFHG